MFSGLRQDGGESKFGRKVVTAIMIPRCESYFNCNVELQSG